MRQDAAFHLPLLSAQLSGRASHAQIHTGYAALFYHCNFTHVQASQGRSLGPCTGNGARCFNATFFFRDFLPPVATNPLSKGSIRTRENSCSPHMLSNGVFRWGNGGVAAKLCLEEPIRRPLPKG